MSDAAAPDSKLPVHIGPHGIRYDFNDGCRVALPPGQWCVRMRDVDTGNILFDQAMTGGMMTSSKRFYVRFGLEIWKDDVSVFSHVYAAEDRIVMVKMELGGLGDHIAWVGAVDAFAARHRCVMLCRVRPDIRPLLQKAYPHIRFVTKADPDPADCYASYKVLVFYNDHDNLYQPTDYRFAGLCHTASYILGVPPIDRRPVFLPDQDRRPIAEPYVCIATQASSQNKYWNNPHGWPEVISFLKAQGYRVICIDQNTVNGRGIVWNHIPHGAEDQTGNRPLDERVNWLRHAAFFVGLSSGLAWLAWAAGIPAVMISGFTHPLNEFQTSFRVINWHACNSCSNDLRHELDPSDFLWCPRHKDTPRAFECTRLITAEQVIRTIRTVPDFGRPVARLGVTETATG